MFATPVVSKSDQERDYAIDQMERNAHDFGIGTMDASLQTWREGQLTNLGEIAGSKFGYANGASGEMMSQDAIKDMFQIDVEEDMTWGEANTRYERIQNVKEARELAALVDSDATGSTVLPFLGGLAGNLWDAETIGLGILAATGVGAAGSAGIFAGTVGNFLAATTLEVAFEEILYQNHYSELMNEEYTWQDSLMNAAAAFTLGGILEFGGSSLKNLYNRSNLKVREAIANHYNQNIAKGNAPEFGAFEKFLMEDKWNGASTIKNPAKSVEDLKSRTFYGVKDGQSYSDMDTNTSKKGRVYSGDEQMAGKHSQDINGELESIQLKPDSKILNLNDAPPELLGRAIDIVAEGDALTRARLQDGTLADIIDELSKPTNNAQINAKRAKQLDAINDLIDSEYDIEWKGGGEIHGEKFNGQYAHDAVRVINEDAVVRGGETKLPPGDGKRVNPRQLSTKQYMDEVDNINNNNTPKHQTDLDQMAEEFDAVEVKAPDKLTEESIAKMDESVDAVHAEEFDKMQGFVEKLQKNPHMNTDAIQGFVDEMDRMILHDKTWTDTSRTKWDKLKEEFNVCKMGGS